MRRGKWRKKGWREEWRGEKKRGAGKARNEEEQEFQQVDCKLWYSIKAKLLFIVEKLISILAVTIKSLVHWL